MSLSKLRKTRNLLGYLLRNQWKLLFVATSILVLVNLSSLGTNLIATYDINTSFSFYGFTIYLSSFLAIILPFILLGYLNNRQQLDFYGNAPIKSKELFETSILAGLIILLIVYIIGFSSNFLISLNFLEYSHFHLIVFVGGLITIIFLYFISSSSFLLVNSPLDALVIIFISFFLLLLAYLAIELISVEIFNKFILDDLEILPYLSILVGGIRLTSYAYDWIETASIDLLRFTLLVIYYLVISYLLLFNSKRLLKNRKTENALTVLNNTKIYKNILFITILLIQINTTIPFIYIGEINILFYFATLFPFSFSSLLYAALMTFFERSFINFKKHLKYYALIGIVAHVLLIVIFSIF